jgi:hypothetical protein
MLRVRAVDWKKGVHIATLSCLMTVLAVDDEAIPIVVPPAAVLANHGAKR